MTCLSPQVELAPPRAGRREWAALAVLTLAVVLLSIDGTVLALALPELTADLHPSATQLLWIGDVYSFALAGLLITMGTLADRVGRKKVLLIGSVGFALASLAGAFAPTAETLIAARALQGIAGATLMPSTLSIIRNLFPDPRQRTTAVTIWTAGASGGAAVGPLVGGVLLAHFWWGSVFTINVPVMLVLLVAGAVLLPESRDPAPGRFDPLSVLLSVLAIVPLVYAIKQAATTGLQADSVVAAAVGLLAGTVFVRRQRRLAVPLLDLSLFASRTFSGTVVANILAMIGFSGLLFFFSQYLQLVRGYSPLKAGLGEMPLTIASIAVVVATAAAVRWFGAGRALGGGLALGGAGFALLGAALGHGYGWLVVPLVIVGLGFGLAFALVTDVTLAAVPGNRAGAASAISEMSYELGVALGIALLGSLHALLYRHALADAPAVAGRSLAEADHSLAPALAELARGAFVDALRVTSYAAGGLLLLGAALAWLTVPSGGRVKHGTNTH